jgi:hypothetical protein
VHFANLHFEMFLAGHSQHPVDAAAYTVIMNVNMDTVNRSDRPTKNDGFQMSGLTVAVPDRELVNQSVSDVMFDDLSSQTQI